MISPTVGRHLAAVLVVVLTVGGCSFSTSADDETVRSDDGAVVEGGDVGALRLRIGDCIAAVSSAEQFTSLPVVPCDEPHEAQVFHALSLTGDDYPGMAEVDRQADEACAAALIDELSHRQDLFELAYAFFTPTESGWNDLADRDVLCVAAFPGRDTTTDLLDTSVTGEAGN